MSFGTKVGLGTGGIVLDRDPAPPLERGTAAPPHFLAHVYTVARRSPISTTAELLFSHDFAGTVVHKVLVESYKVIFAVLELSVAVSLSHWL